MKLTEREIELIDGMIEVQQRHADQCLRMMDDPHGNATMAVRQLEWDTERINLLKRIKDEANL
jgi:hypothetical protein